MAISFRLFIYDRLAYIVPYYERGQLERGKGTVLYREYPGMQLKINYK
jgi:hypothetical protein